MQNIKKQASEEEVECLPELAWVLLAVAFVPHVLALAGSINSAVIASYICFPISMGPFALAHGCLLNSRLGFSSHMAWISAVTFSLIWSAILCLRFKRKLFQE